MSKFEMSICHRCGSVLRAEATVCTACCTPQTAVAAQPFQLEDHQPVIVAPDAPAAEAGLAAWPFGRADAEAAAQVAARTAAAEVSAELSQYSAQSATHVLPGLPTQRLSALGEDFDSVPSCGPNPFLAAARLQQARDEAAAVEGYPV